MKKYSLLILFCLLSTGFAQPVLKTGWPMATTSVVTSSLTAADVNFSPTSKEVIAVDQAGTLYCINTNGTTLWSTIVSTDGSISSPAIGYINTDDTLDVVLGAANGRVYAYNAMTGRALTGWPRDLQDGPVNSSALLVNVDADTLSEVVIGSFGGKLWCLDGNGSTLWSRQLSQQGLRATAAAADLNRDGLPEIVVGDYSGSLYALTIGGANLNGFPVSTGGAIDASPAIGDLDRDGWFEIVVGNRANVIKTYRNTGSLYWTYQGTAQFDASPAIGFVNNSDTLNVAAVDRNGAIVLLTGTGNIVTGFPVLLGTQVQASPVLGDVSGDGFADIVVGATNLMLYAVTGNGTHVTNWPLRPVANPGQIRGAALLSDIDNDSVIDVVFGTWSNRVFAYSCGVPSIPVERFPWPQFHRDETHSGVNPTLGSGGGGSEIQVAQVSVSPDSVYLNAAQFDNVVPLTFSVAEARGVYGFNIVLKIPPMSFSPLSSPNPPDLVAAGSVPTSAQALFQYVADTTTNLVTVGATALGNNPFPTSNGSLFTLMLPIRGGVITCGAESLAVSIESISLRDSALRPIQLQLVDSARTEIYIRAWDRCDFNINNTVNGQDANMFGQMFGATQFDLEQCGSDTVYPVWCPTGMQQLPCSGDLWPTTYGDFVIDGNDLMVFGQAFGRMRSVGSPPRPTIPRIASEPSPVRPQLSMDSQFDATTNEWVTTIRVTDVRALHGWQLTFDSSTPLTTSEGTMLNGDGIPTVMLTNRNGNRTLLAATRLSNGIGVTGSGVLAVVRTSQTSPLLTDAVLRDSELEEIPLHAVTTPERSEIAIPQSMSMTVAPNPFNPVTTVTLQLQSAVNVTVTVIDELGREVELIHQGILPAGNQQFVWNGSRFAAGRYFVRAMSSSGVVVQPVTLLK
ncbi:MAG: T9SS type A sorting domain-containing protein [bacterium]|nr:T9SS type A sorting domain-containing protein [bacterium]